MATPSVKELKKLATMCRKLGIKSFKGDGFEFTLSDESPQPRIKTANKPLTTQSDKPFETDSLSQEDLLFWSTGEVPESKGETQ